MVKMSDIAIYELERIFNAPRRLVWRAFTESELLSRWYGPGVETIIHKLTVEVGGLWLDEMRMGEKSHFERIEYIEVVPQERLVWLQSVTDGNWQSISNPMMPDWPSVMKAVVRFEDLGEQTKLHFTWVPHEATEAEMACFANAIEGLGKGWNAGMDAIEVILEELQAAK
jgi:uncharacterized protein YndB with AHSA1/START domain